jgi:hypothetical protein
VVPSLSLPPSRAKDVVVITGPAYLPCWSKENGYVLNIKTVGAFPHLIHVPTHFFKVILTRTREEEEEEDSFLSTQQQQQQQGHNHKQRVVISCAAFLIPNTDDDYSVESLSSHYLISDFVQYLFSFLEQFKSRFYTSIYPSEIVDSEQSDAACACASTALGARGAAAAGRGAGRSGAGAGGTSSSSAQQAKAASISKRYESSLTRFVVKIEDLEST